MASPSSSSSATSYNFGTCPNPAILYDPAAYSFTPANLSHFPFPPSFDIATLESSICDRLRGDDCEASSEAVDACDRARWSFSGLAGQQAADAWNTALGVGASAGAVVVESVTVVTYSSSAVAPRTSTTSVESTSSEEPDAAETVTTTTVLQSTASTEIMTTTSSLTTSRVASALPETTDDGSNGSPFGYQNGSPQSPKRPRKMMLGLMTGFLLLLAPPI